jgi:hypothetical protein
VKHLATKEELQRLRVELILWIVGTNVLVGGAILSAMLYLNDQLETVNVSLPSTRLDRQTAQNCRDHFCGRKADSTIRLACPGNLFRCLWLEELPLNSGKTTAIAKMKK